jgi:hypothetical protein
VRYPFDVDAAMDELAKEASLVLVFLDPMGKALVNRCMRAVVHCIPKVSLYSGVE